MGGDSWQGGIASPRFDRHAQKLIGTSSRGKFVRTIQIMAYVFCRSYHCRNRKAWQPDSFRITKRHAVFSNASQSDWTEVNSQKTRTLFQVLQSYGYRAPSGAHAQLSLTAFTNEFLMRTCTLPSISWNSTLISRFGSRLPSM